MTAAALTKTLQSVWEDLRERRLWPVPLLLLVGIVAVPVLLSRTPSPPPAPAPLAAGGASNPAGLAVAALNSSAGPGHSNLHGHGRDPFGGSGTTTAGTTPATGTATTASPTGSAAGTSTSPSSTSSSSATSGSGSSTVASTPAPSGGAPAPPLPAHKPVPTPSGLSSTQSYDVQLSITNASGGLDRLESVPRLTPLPNAQKPLLVELGVLQDRHRVLFAVAPGTVLRGPGRCVPGPIDCEILSLGEDEIESLSASVSSSPAAMFAITDIRVADHPSAPAAQQARRSESAPGRQFLGKLSLSALSLFQYDAGIGAVVDLRNLFNGAS